jgi:uncharacterized membrane protein
VLTKNRKEKMIDIEDGPKDWKWQIFYFNREVM